MKTVTIDKAMVDLKAMVKDSLQNSEEIIIASDEGAVIMLPQEDYESMQETLKLLMDKKSLQALLKGHLEKDAGLVSHTHTIEDVFHDL